MMRELPTSGVAGDWRSLEWIRNQPNVTRIPRRPGSTSANEVIGHSSRTDAIFGQDTMTADILTDWKAVIWTNLEPAKRGAFS
jgi:hypothetical protein